jgi:hypothetical protein
MMLWALGGLVLLFVLWRGWGKPVLTRGQWRSGAGLLSIGGLVGAAFLGIRGAWELSLALLVMSTALLFAARSQRGLGVGPGASKPNGALSLQEARDLLGVAAGASASDIRAAHARLMRLAHPDRGGTSGLAAQLNAARDRLLGKP